MAAVHIGYEPAGRTCSGGPTAGARALLSWWIGAYRGSGATNLGIYNCRNVAGSATRSLHGEGRAGDLGVNPHRAGYGWDAARALHRHSRALGVQLVIWDRKIWSGSQPHAGWRDYRGDNPHVDHLHVSLSRAAARDLTPERIQGVLGGGAAVPGSTAPTTGGKRNLRLTEPRMNGYDVRTLQRVLADWYPHLRISVDGWYGPGTEAAVRHLQGRAGITVDGVAGPQTRAVLRL